MPCVASLGQRCCILDSHCKGIFGLNILNIFRMSTESNSQIPFTLLVNGENRALCSKAEKPRLLELFPMARESEHVERNHTLPPASGGPIQTIDFSLPSDVGVQACNKVVITEGDRLSANKGTCIAAKIRKVFMACLWISSSSLWHLS